MKFPGSSRTLPVVGGRAGAFLVGWLGVIAGIASARISGCAAGSGSAVGLAREASPSNGARFVVTIDPAPWKKFGFRYPATYVFHVERPTPDWAVRRRETGSDAWSEAESGAARGSGTDAGSEASCVFQE